MEGILELQGFFLVTLVLITGLAYFLPYWLLLRRAQDASTSGESRHCHIISLTNSLSCGILLGTCFLGMWPAAESKWLEVAGAAAAGGRKERLGTRADGEDEAEEMRAEVPWHNIIVLLGFSTIFSLQHVLSARYGGEDQEQHRENHSDNREGGEDEEDDDDEEEEGDSWPGEKAMLHEAAEVIEERRRTRRRRREATGDHCGGGGALAVGTGQHMTVFETLSLVFVVSWHTVLEGVSLGVQTDPSTAKALFAGVASHAALMAVAVALVAVPAWVAAGWSAAKVAAVLGAMVLMRPIGMAVGVSLGRADASSPTMLLASAALQSASVGLFLHLIFMGIIPTEFKRRSSQDGGEGERAGGGGRWWMVTAKLGLLVLGWVGYLALVLSFGHDHDHH